MNAEVLATKQSSLLIQTQSSAVQFLSDFVKHRKGLLSLSCLSVRAGQTTFDNMAHPHYKLGTKGYKLTLRMCNTFLFSTATIAVRMRLNVTSYLYRLCCLVVRSFDSIHISQPVCSCM
jgi:hypothetical protein